MKPSSLSLVQTKRTIFFLSYVFLTAVSRSQVADEISDIIRQGGCRMIVQRCGVQPTNVQDLTKPSHVLSATVLRIVSLETLAKLPYEHRTTRAVSKGCRRIIARLFGLRINLLAANFAA